MKPVFWPATVNGTDTVNDRRIGSRDPMPHFGADGRRALSFHSMVNIAMPVENFQSNGDHRRGEGVKHIGLFSQA